jgi:assimilatory nitrate reductase catalytic subunit
MTRTGLSPRLARHREEPLVEIHPADAERFGLDDGGLARVGTPQGDSLFRVRTTDAQRPGEMFTPIHWTDRHSTGGRTGLLARDTTDPISGQPGFKMTPARIAAVACAWRGFLIARGAAAAPDCLWTTRVTVSGGTLFELAGDSDPAMLEKTLPKGDRIEASDPARGTRRIAVLDKGRLAAVLFVTRAGALPSRDWLIAQLDREHGLHILAGRAPGDQPDRGPIVCVCLDVGLKTILATIRDQRLADIAAIGEALGAGTSCGSCRPALARILGEERSKAADG